MPYAGLGDETKELVHKPDCEATRELITNREVRKEEFFCTLPEGSVEGEVKVCRLTFGDLSV